MIGLRTFSDEHGMAGKNIRGCEGFAIALVLLSAISFCSGENLHQNAARTVHPTEDEADLARRASPLIDSKGRLRLRDGWQLAQDRKDVTAITENGPIVGTKAVTSYMDVERRRKKRFVFLLPLLPLFGGLTAGSVATVAAVGVGATAAVVAAQQGPIQIPRFTTNSGSSTYMESKKTYKPESKTEKQPEKKERKGQLPPGQSHHSPPRRLEGFPDFEPTSAKSQRKRWRNPKTKEFLEWDYEKGEVEKYNKRGEHLGSFQPDTGAKKKGPVPGREADP